MKACMKCYSIDNLKQVALFTDDVDLYLCTDCINIVKSFTEWKILKKSYHRYKKIKELGI